MSDLEIIFLCALLLAFVVLPWLGVAAWRDFLRSALGRALVAAWRDEPAAAKPPPAITFLRSADGSVPLAQLRNGELRSLKPEPKGKAERKFWKRARRTLPAVTKFMERGGGHRRPALIAALKRQSLPHDESTLDPRAAQKV